MTVFANGEDLVRHYAPVYDVIFLDIDMPRRNGRTWRARFGSRIQHVLKWLNGKAVSKG